LALAAGCGDSSPPAVSEGCGNAVLEAELGEECDDGNEEQGDGCSANCRLEALEACQGVVDAPPGPLAVAEIAAGLNRPIGGAAAPDDLRRIYVLEQDGRIRVIKDGVLLSRPFLDLSSRVRGDGERGLLGLAFAPDFVVSRVFYVYYTRRSDRAQVLERYQAPSADRADADSARELLVMPDPAANHNGGQLAFGPRDGLLYVATGDGGGVGDPFNNAQNTSTLLGKRLRLDVSGAAGYRIPASNPFASNSPQRGEIWAFGLRNPWRFSFDRESGDLYIGDVGQNAFEELNFQAASSPGGENYGWPVVEGLGHCFRPASDCEQSGLVQPVLDYGHEGVHCSIIGGFVYRGCRMPWLRGTYFFSDYCSGFVRSLRIVSGAPTELTDRTDELGPSGGLGRVTSYLEDARGELYLLSHGGTVFQLVPR
jgi:cysteine-rich repeat protein